jgi:colanic acid/amylovoran biosynthesis protein
MPRPAPGRILLTNVHSAHNAGDAALMLAAIEQLQAAFPTARLTVLMNDPQSFAGPPAVVGSLFTWVKWADGAGREHWRWAQFPVLLLAGLAAGLGRWLPRPAVRLLPRARRLLVQSFLEADLVVGCPGGYLFSAGRGLPLLISVYTLALGWLAGKPIYLLPQSIGPLRRGWERRAVGWLLARARLILVREAISLRQAPIAAGSRKLRLLPNMAFVFSGAPRPIAEHWLHSAGVDLSRDRPCLGLTAINWHAQNPGFVRQAAYEQALAGAVRRFIGETGGTAIFFPQVCGPSLEQDDRVAARRVAAHLADLGGRVRLIEQPPEPSVLKTALGVMDVFVGTRMHSNLFALAGGAPCLAIGYQFKTLGMVDMVGLSDWVVDIEAVSDPELANRLMRLWQARREVRAHLERTAPALMSQARQATALIAEDYFGG